MSKTVNELRYTVDLKGMAKEVIAFLVANKVAARIAEEARKNPDKDFYEIPNFMLDIRGPSGAGKTTTMKIIESALSDDIKVVRTAGPSFYPEIIKGIPAITPESIIKRIKSDVIEAIQKAHKENKTVILYIDEIDKMPAEGHEVLLNLISPAERKALYDIEGELFVVMTGNPKKKGFNFRLGEMPIGSVERTYTVELRRPSIKSRIKARQEQIEIKNMIKKAKLNELVDKILSKVNIQEFFHPFVEALTHVYEKQIEELADEEKGTEIAGVYKYPTARAFDYAALYLHAWEALEGKLDEETVGRVFYGLMGSEIASMAKELYTQIYETNAYTYMDAVNKMNYEKFIESLKTGELYRILGNVQQVPASIFFVAFNLRNHITSERSSIEEKANYSLALNTYLAHAIKTGDPLVKETVNSLIASSIASFAEKVSELANKKQITMDTEKLEQLNEKVFTTLSNALEQYYTGNPEPLKDAVKKLKKEGFDIDSLDISAISAYVLSKMAEEGKVEPNLGQGLEKLYKNMETLTDNSEQMFQRAKAFKRKP